MKKKYSEKHHSGKRKRLIIPMLYNASQNRINKLLDNQEYGRTIKPIPELDLFDIFLILISVCLFAAVLYFGGIIGK